MSFRPIDLQVNLGQLNHVARGQQNERAQPLLDQATHAAHIIKESDVKQHVVEGKGQASNEESRVAWRRQKEGERRRRRAQAREAREKKSPPGGNVILRESDTPEKGGMIDTLR